MNNLYRKSRISLYAIFALVALVILVDFVAPGRTIKDTIIQVLQER